MTSLNPELSDIKLSDDEQSWIFPHYYLEDYYIDYFDDMNIDYEIEFSKQGSFCTVNKEAITRACLHMLRAQALGFED